MQKLQDLILTFLSHENAKEYVRYFHQFSSLKTVKNNNDTYSVIFEGSEIDYAIYLDTLLRIELDEIQLLETTGKISSQVAKEIRLGKQKESYKKMNDKTINIKSVESLQKTALIVPQKPIIDVKKELIKIVNCRSKITKFNYETEELNIQIEVTKSKLNKLKDKQNILDKKTSELNNSITESSTSILKTFKGKHEKFIAKLNDDHYVVKINNNIEIEHLKVI